jgi:hypothetical protein
MATKSESKVEALKKKREQLDKRIRKMEALEKQRERKRDTRRKILVGSYYLDEAVKNNKWNEIVAIMDKYLKRNSDRSLFDLESKE